MNFSSILDLFRSKPAPAQQVSRYRDFDRTDVPYDPNRRWREEQFKTENKATYLELYEKHGGYYAAVRAKALALAQRGIKVYKIDKTTGKRVQELQDGYIYNLMHRPNPNETKVDFFEAVVSYLELTGDCFIEKNDPVFPTQLYVLRPDYVEIKTSPKTLVEGYEYKPEGVVSTLFNREDVIHIKYFHPRSEVYGFSFTQASKESAILDFLAIKFQKKFFEQGGSIGAYISTKEQLSPEEYKRAKQQYMEAYEGMKNSHKAIFLDNDGKFVSVNQDFGKAMLKDQRDKNRDEIFSAAGVPPLMSGLLTGDSTYNNSQTQEKSFWQNAVIPTAKKIESKFNSDLLWNIGYEIEFDFSDIAVLQEAGLTKAQEDQIYIATGVLSRDEVRERLGMKPATFPVPSTAPAYPAYQPEPVAKADNRKAFMQSLLDQNEAQAFEAIKPAFDRMLSAVTAKVSGGIKKVAGIDDIIGVLDAETKGMAADLLKWYKQGLLGSAQKNYTRLTGGPLKDTKLKNATSALYANIDEWAAKSADEIVSTMADRTTAFVDEALKTNMSIDDLTKGIQDIFQGTDRESYPWARAIARTESSKVANEAIKTSMSEAGYTKKEWVSAGGPNARPGHAAMNGVVVGINEKFTLPNGVKMDYPGDPSAPVGELVNCRDTIIEA